MRRFSGFLALIVLVAIGLGVVYYDRLWPDASRTEMPSAITAGTQEGPGDEAAETTPAIETAAAPSADEGKAAVAETPSAKPAPADAMASAAPPATVESPVATDAPVAAADRTPPAPASGDGAVAAASPTATPETTPEPASPDAAEAPAAVAPEVAAQSAPDVTVPAAEPAPDTSAAMPEATAPEVAAASEAEPEAPAAEPAASDEPAATLLAPEAGTETETQIALAPEVQPDAPDGTTPPVSESSGRDSMMQASPGPETVPAAPETVVAAVDPTADVEAPKPAAAPDAIAPGTDSETVEVVPSFDVVRVEPTGDAVVAGVAAPGATVELIDGASTVASAVASDTGEWAIALEQPLPAGQHDLAIRSTSRDTGTVTQSDQRVAVLVPELPAEEPLVVLNAPDAPSTILQVPAVPEPGPADVAALDAPAAPDGAAGSPVGEGAAAPADAALPPPPPAVVTEPATPEVGADVTVAGPAPSGPADTVTDVAATPAISPDGPAPGASAGETEVAAVPPGTEPGEASTAPVVTGPAPETAAGEAAAASPETAPDVAVAEPEPVITPVVAVTAVEAETSGALFIAGTTVTPEDVRVYVDDVLLGEVTPSPSGTWLLEVKRELPAGTYNVRADQVEPGAGTVLARAEVPFERDVEVAILRPVAEAGSVAGAEATGTMAGPTTLIIKRSDNLWRISRQLYGQGIRWSTIYQANKDQIRNPRWIYPGQVFILPEGNVEWAGEAAD